MMQAGEMLETHFKSYASIGFNSFVMQDIKLISWENTYTLVTGFDGSVSCNMVITFMIQMNDKGLTSKIRNRLVFYIGLFFENPIWLIYTWYQSMITKVVCVLYCFQRLLWLHHKLLCKASIFFGTPCVSLALTFCAAPQVIVMPEYDFRAWWRHKGCHWVCLGYRHSLFYTSLALDEPIKLLCRAPAW